MRPRGRSSRIVRTKRSQRTASTSAEPLTVDIETLSHEGRGIARVDGKTLFVRDALPGETAVVRIDRQHRRYDEGHMIELKTAAAERTEPGCQHAALCGGCQLQHLHHDHQISHKERWVLEQLERQAGLTPEQIDTPLRSADSHYRRAARIGINQRKDGSAVVGFRQQASKHLTDIEQCMVLDKRGETLFTELKALLDQYPGQIKRITHAELTLGDGNGALTLRVMKNLDGGLQQRLTRLARSLDCTLYLDFGDHTACAGDGDTEAPGFDLPAFDLRLTFAPGDFIQVNAGVNQQMIERALEWLAPQQDERILDLFCGLGNFTLPLATRASEVVGVEGSKDMVARGEHNARLNGLENCQFEAADLTQPIANRTWFRQGFDKVLIDPPRTGALEVIEQLVKTPISQLLYVSCNPAALARDAAVLKEAGFRLQRFCVMDMFPHTTHVESLAMFIKE